MRIMHNVTAMNSYRNFSTNSSNLAKNLEKLSSGYKINRAGDDAAGLAISEKMRAQITGLEGATKNAKDGISLIQTAEGALTEVHSMLNRMTTLAEQSANGTYQNELDREQLQKEVTALKSEIDRVADSTNFNGLKLLDGSLSDKFETVTTAPSAISDIKSTDYSAKGASDAFGVREVVNRPTANSSMTVAKFDVSLKDISMAGLADNDTITLTVGDAKITATLKAASASYANAGDIAKIFATSGSKTSTATTEMPSTGGTAAASTAANWHAALTGAGTTSADNKYVEIDGHTYSMTSSGETITFTQVDRTDASKDINPNFGVSLSMKVSGNGDETDAHYIGKYTDGTKEGGEDPNWQVQNTQTGKSIGASHQAKALVDIDFSKLKNGDTLMAGNKTFGFQIGTNSRAATTATNGNIDLSDIFKTDADLADADKQKQAMVKITAQMATAFNAESGSGTGKMFTVGNAGVDGGVGTLSFQSTSDWIEGKNATVANKVLGGDTSTNELIDLTTEDGVKAAFAGFSAEQDATTSFELDVTKIKVGDTFTIDGKTFEFTDGEDASERGSVAIDLSKQNISAGFTKSQQGAVMKEIEKAIAGDGTYGAFTKQPGIQNPNGDAKYKVDISGSTIKLTSKDDPTSKSFENRVAAKVETPTEVTHGEGLVLQIGDTAESYNKLTVSIEDMHSKALGIGDLDISTQEGAAAALDKIKSAINAVSDTRGNMGALQNRLDHTINNLGVMRENIQSAESMIRDTDVAEEMMTYTKNNILNQSAQAMLAQANQLPQGVLQLLG